MRIAMVSEHASPLASVGGVDAGGQNVHVAALAAGLVRRGHEVTVFTRRDDPALPWRTTTSDGYAVEHVPAGPPTEIPKDELWPHMPAFASYLDLRWSVDRFDLVHSHFWMSGMASVAAAKPNGVPVVHTFHALGTVKRRHQGSLDTSPAQRRDVEADLCRDVDHVIATCRDEVRELDAMGMPSGRASVVPCGVDLDLFASRPRRRTGSPPRLLVVGRLVRRKGVDDVVQALAHLPGVELLIAGGQSHDSLVVDPEARRLREIAAANGTAHRVHFLGSVARADMPALFHSADVVVTVPWYEPFGIVPLEAMACGRPVVGSAVGGLLDTVVPGVTGELVPPRRPDLLAVVLRDLLAHPRRRAAYGSAGAERVRRRFGWRRVVAETERVYARVVAHASAEVVR